MTLCGVVSDLAESGPREELLAVRCACLKRSPPPVCYDHHAAENRVHIMTLYRAYERSGLMVWWGVYYYYNYRIIYDTLYW